MRLGKAGNRKPFVKPVSASRFVWGETGSFSGADRLPTVTSRANSGFLTGGRENPLGNSDRQIGISHSEPAPFHTEYREWRYCLRHRDRGWLLQRSWAGTGEVRGDRNSSRLRDGPCVGDDSS